MKFLLSLACIVLFCAAHYADSGTRGKVRTQTVELSGSEKSFALDSFAGFRFGCVGSENVRYKNHKLNAPFRAFTGVKLRYTDFTHKLSKIELFGSVADWDNTSVSNEVECLRKMIAAQYGIRLLPRRAAIGGLGFENDNVAIDIFLLNKSLSLVAMNKSIVAEDKHAYEASKRSVVFSDVINFTEFDHIADSIKSTTSLQRNQGEQFEELKDLTLKSGYVYTRPIPLFTNTLDSSKWSRELKKANASENAGIIMMLPTRIVGDGNDAYMLWRKFYFNQDGCLNAVSGEMGGMCNITMTEDDM